MDAKYLLCYPYRGWAYRITLWTVYNIHDVMDVYVVYNDSSVLTRIGSELKTSHFFHFMDDRTHSGRKDGWKLKGSFGAKLTPFAVIFEEEKPLKAFYSETGEDVIESLIKYLNE